MTVGTRSLLYGAHAFWLHPWFVALAWYRLYGFPWDPRLWVAFVIHDWGYAGSPDMDGAFGEQHPYWAARVMERLFDPKRQPYSSNLGYWARMSLYHSRFLARKENEPPSQLCWADKLAFSLEPWWLYLPRAWATGEIREYLSDAVTRYGLGMEEANKARSPWAMSRRWHRGAQAKMAAVAFAGAAEHYKCEDEKLSPPKSAYYGPERYNVWPPEPTPSWVDFWTAQRAAGGGVLRCRCGRLTSVTELVHSQHPVCPDCGHDWRPRSPVDDQSTSVL